MLSDWMNILLLVYYYLIFVVHHCACRAENALVKKFIHWSETWCLKKVNIPLPNAHRIHKIHPCMESTELTLTR